MQWWCYFICDLENIGSYLGEVHVHMHGLLNLTFPTLPCSSIIVLQYSNRWIWTNRKWVPFHEGEHLTSSSRWCVVLAHLIRCSPDYVVPHLIQRLTSPWHSESSQGCYLHPNYHWNHSTEELDSSVLQTHLAKLKRRAREITNTEIVTDACCIESWMIACIKLLYEMNTWSNFLVYSIQLKNGKLKLWVGLSSSSQVFVIWYTLIK